MAVRADLAAIGGGLRRGRPAADAAAIDLGPAANGRRPWVHGARARDPTSRLSLQRRSDYSRTGCRPGPYAAGFARRRRLVERGDGGDSSRCPGGASADAGASDGRNAAIRPEACAAMENIRQAQGDYVTSSLLPNPTVQINECSCRCEPSLRRPRRATELDVIGTFPIDWYLFGKRAAARANAQIGVAVSDADYSDQVRQRLANTASAFYDVLEARAMLKLAEEDLANLRHVEGITTAGVKFGGTGRSRPSGSDSPCWMPSGRCGTRATTLATSKAQLRAAIGRARQDAALRGCGRLGGLQASGADSLGAAIALAEQNRPDIISLRRQIAKARSGIEVEQTKARPSVQPSLGYQYQYQECNGVADANAYTAQVNVSVPIFDRNQGNIAKAQSVLAQSCFNLQAQLVQTEADVEQAVGEFQAAQTDALLIGPRQLATARSVRDRTVTAYSLGGKTLLDVLDAQRAYRDTYRNFILGQSAYWHALHRLNAAVGQKMLQ